MTDKLLKPNSYPEPPFLMRLKYLLKKDWPIIPFSLLILAATVWMLIANGITGGTIAMIGLFVAVLGVGAWAAWWHAGKTFQPFYDVHGVNVEFESPKYYVPREVMSQFVGSIIEKFRPVVDFEPAEMFEGVTLVIKDERPADPLGRVSRDEMVGLSYTRARRTSYVYGPYALDEGGLGYELKLHGCAFLYPDRPEGEDIAWMEKNGI